VMRRRYYSFGLRGICPDQDSPQFPHVALKPEKPHPISGRLGGTMACGAKIVWPIPDLTNELRID
jgi:hypothetical protein